MSVEIPDTGLLALEKIERLEREAQEEILERTAEVRRQMSPSGALKLPKLLEKKRLRYGLIDALFRIQATLNRVLVYQLEPEEYAGGIAGGGESGLHVPEVAQARLKFEAPRGIIVSMGLDAMLSLRRNGVTLGHTILMTQPSPLSIDVGYLHGEEEKLFILMDRDINGSYDLEEARKDGRVECRYFPPTRSGDKAECLLIDPRDGSEWDPEDVPFVDLEDDDAE